MTIESSSLRSPSAGESTTASEAAKNLGATGVPPSELEVLDQESIASFIEDSLASPPTLGDETGRTVEEDGLEDPDVPPPPLEEVVSPQASPPLDSDITEPPELLFSDLDPLEGEADLPLGSSSGGASLKRSLETAIGDSEDVADAGRDNEEKKKKKKRRVDPETEYLRQLGFLPESDDEEPEDEDSEPAGIVDPADRKADQDSDEELEEMEPYEAIVYDEEDDPQSVLKDYIKLHPEAKIDDSDEEPEEEAGRKEDEEEEEEVTSYPGLSELLDQDSDQEEDTPKPKRPREGEVQEVESSDEDSDDDEYDSDSDDDTSGFPSRKRLEEIENTLESALEFLEKCKNVVVLTGAGVSVSSGIPDFRSKGGVYDTIAKTYDLPRPECLFDLTYLKVNPKPFFEFAKELLPGRYQPSPTHRFLKLLQEKGKLRRLYTQNIDTLDYLVGIPPEKIVACHGSMATATCIQCKAKFTCEDIREDIEQQRIPH